MLQDLTQSLQSHPNKAHVLWELSSCISSAVGADGFNLYLAETSDPTNLVQYIGDVSNEQNLASGDKKIIVKNINKNNITVPIYVARTREPVRLSRGDVDSRFPEGVPNKVIFN